MSTWRSWERRPTTLSRPARHPLRAARDPRRELRPRPARRGEDRLASTELRVLDYGDAPVVPADPAAHGRRDRAAVGEVLDAGAIPIMLGGDHSIADPDIRACAPCMARSGWSTSTPTPTPAAEVFGVEVSHGTPMYRLVEEGHVVRSATCRSACAATGRARRSSPGRASTASPPLMTTSTRSGIDAAIERAVEVVGDAQVSSPSTSTCSIRPSRRAPARWSRAA